MGVKIISMSLPNGTSGWPFRNANNRDHFVYAPSKWEITLHHNVILHWQGAYTKGSQKYKCIFVISVKLNWSLIPEVLLTICHHRWWLSTGYATGSYLNQRWPWSMAPLGHNWVLSSWVRPYQGCNCFNTLRPWQNGRHFPDDIFQCIFLNEKFRFHRNLFQKAPINNILSLVQIMAWCHPSDKPWSQPMTVNFLTHICIIRPQWVNGVISYFEILNGILST